MSSTDRIEKQVMLKAPRARVWAAIADAEQFGAWFRAVFDGEFVAGERAAGRITYPGYEHMRFELWVEEVEPERLFAFRWHPSAVDEGRDYSTEPTTRVEFRLEDAPGGTLLTVVESGYDRLPRDRRDEALRSNTEGWQIQMGNIAEHVEG